MKRRHLFYYFVFPALSLVAYFVNLWFLPSESRHWFHREIGLIERGTAVFFVLAACVAAALYFKTRDSVVKRYRVLYLAFALAGLFVALEEVSWGQKVFWWESPQWFVQHNHKAETNLHNMFGSKPSHRLRAIASVGCPFICIVLPLLVLRRRGQYTSDHWAYFLLPRKELICLATVTLVLTALNRFDSIRNIATWRTHFGELKEFYWSVTAFFYVIILWQRLVSSAAKVEMSTIPVADRVSTDLPERKVA